MKLSRITAQRKRRDFLVYDMEWYPGMARLKSDGPVNLSEKLRLVGAYDGETYKHWTSVDGFLNEMLTRQNADKWFYAHYGGMADSIFLLEAMVRRANEGFIIDASFSGSSAIIIHVVKGDLEWHFIDSFWLMRDRLANIGEAVGEKKTGEDYICSNFPDCGHFDHHETRYTKPGQLPYPMCVFWASMPELIEYNEQDCKILYKAIKQFEEVLHGFGGQLQMTIASCAMHLFRRKYLKQDIRTSETINNIGRLAYTSSRVEVFQSSCESADYYDINSSFPYSMTFPCPGEAIRGYANKLPPRSDAMYLADCTIKVPASMYLPPLPYRHKGRVFFPTGQWRSWFTNIDLELLQKRGGDIVAVHRSVEFETQMFLRDYALDIYEERNKAKRAKNGFASLTMKLLLNSLYGKFGEAREKTSMLLNPKSLNCPHDIKHRCPEWPRCLHALAGQECNLCLEPLFPGALLVTAEANLAHEWVPIADFITSRSRANLEGHLWQAQSDLSYCDTDSCITAVAMQSDPYTLGALKHEYSIRNGIFVACKLYALQVRDEKGEHDAEGHKLKEASGVPVDYWETKAKGFSKMSYAKFIDIKLGKDIAMARMTRIRELYRKAGRRPAGEAIDKYIAPQESVVLKRLVQECLPKRCPLEGSPQTRPWSVEEIDREQVRTEIALSL